jgi:hypothetical protein
VLQHRHQRRQKIANDRARLLPLKALGNNLVNLRLIDLTNERLAEVFYQARRTFLPARDSIALDAFRLTALEIRQSCDCESRGCLRAKDRLI